MLCPKRWTLGLSWKPPPPPPALPPSQFASWHSPASRTPKSKPAGLVPPLCHPTFWGYSFMCVTATWFADQAKVFNSLRTCMQTRSVSHRNAFEELSANDKLEGGRDVCVSQPPSFSLNLGNVRSCCWILCGVGDWESREGGEGRSTQKERLGHI